MNAYYRIAQIAEREGVTLARSTLGDWVGRAGFELAPLYDRLKEMLLAGTVLHVDETPIKQLDPGNKKTHKAYLWGYRNNDLDEGPPIVLFDYQAGRAGIHARNFLGDWRGFLCADDYQGVRHEVANIIVMPLKEESDMTGRSVGRSLPVRARPVTGWCGATGTMSPALRPILNREAKVHLRASTWVGG